ncbi:hypothetical protein RCO27_00915 [Sphingosinicella sp. LHD-64]|uniref:hypothetical protein n=1 Tax=Sphingosinicella sp. LHD-64 TaxID=3072139 RepID=UPI00280D5989|nr:hypothetical protein [Sphingosinicella sp. LHD-64]MDQ8754777.1 hypothetical protein [Sphingosinicella sp. LHD-64]
MSMGVERAVAQPQDEAGWSEAVEPLPAATESFDFSTFVEEEEAPPATGLRVFAGTLILLAVVWVGLAGYALWQAWPGADLAGWTGWIASISAPLILLGLAWTIFGRTPRRETEAFSRAVAGMRQEAQALESLLGIVAQRLGENRAALSQEAARLMSLGDEASDRLGRVTQDLARGSTELDRSAQALDAAAGSARVDIGVLLTDLPRAEAQARAVAESMRSAGLNAHEQAAGLEGYLAALTARGREADEVVGGAAQRLGAHVARIESSASAASERMEQASAQMNAAVDAAMARAAESVDRARGGLEAQGQTMLAMVEQSRAAFEQAGAEAGQRLSAELETAGAAVATLGDRLATQEAASRTLVEGITAQLAELDDRLCALGQSGDEQNARLSQSVGVLREVTGALNREVEAGSAASGQLIDRTHELATALGAMSGQFREELTSALADVEGQAGRTHQAVKSVVPSMEAVQAAAALAAESMAESEASAARQRESLDAMIGTVREAVGLADEKLRALGSTVSEADSAAARLVQETGPQLIDALVRVRDAANQAAHHAREAIVAVIPDSVSALVEASRDAVAEAVAEPVQDQIAEVAGASQRAMAVARQASERLTRQLLVMSETAAAIEDRIATDQAERAERDAGAMSRRVSLLIEALNSTAIDVNKLLSNDVADTAWAAYLKGDRGVFTRRAVRLLDSGEAREVLRHYDEEPDFRDQVNRYVHDFEAMLRRVLADRDGEMMGVTLLSSDMGKLYVALAQAIQRLRS